MTKRKPLLETAKFKNFKAIVDGCYKAGLNVELSERDDTVRIAVSDETQERFVMFQTKADKGQMLIDGEFFEEVGIVTQKTGSVARVKNYLKEAVKRNEEMSSFVALVHECKSAGFFTDVEDCGTHLEMRAFDEFEDFVEERPKFVVKTYFDLPKLMILGGEWVGETGVTAMPTESISEIKSQLAYAVRWHELSNLVANA